MRHMVIVLCMFIGCSMGGLNQNQHTPGNEDNGTMLNYGDIAIDPTGRHVIYGTGKVLQMSDLDGGARHAIDAITTPLRVAFGPAGSNLFYVVGRRDGQSVLAALDLTTRAVRWSRPLSGSATGDYSVQPWIDSTPDGRFVVLTDSRRVDVVSTADGRLKHTVTTDRFIQDVDITPDSSRVLITELHEWDGASPSTRIHSLVLGGGAVTSFTVPNCSSELVLTPDARHAFLAPTTCQKDPVSLIDLEHNRFERNLPGFGPVAVSPGGDLAVAFIDATKIDATLFDDPSKIPAISDGRYHLMLIDTRTLDFETVPIGEDLPRYAITPDGRVLLVDSPVWYATGRIRLLDVQNRAMVNLSGEADVSLESFVMTSDAAHVFLLFAGLYRIDISDARLIPIELPFAPTNINITADDGFLILRESDTKLWIYDVARGTLAGMLDTTPIAALRM